MAFDKSYILIAEDSKLFSTMLKDAFEKEGFSAAVAEDGSKAYEKLMASTVAIDLLILDLNMPNMDGMELLAKIKSENLIKLPPTLILTATTPDTAMLSSFREMGAKGYIVKNQPTSEIIFRIKSVLGKNEDKRKDLRELMSIPIEYSLSNTGRFLSVRSFDFSKQGAFIATTNPATVGSILQIRFTIPDLKAKMLMNAKVAFVIKLDSPVKGTYPPGMGVKFLFQDEDQEKALEKHLNFLARKRI